MMDKKGALDLVNYWVEFAFLGLLLIGMLVTLASQNKIVNTIIVLLAGFMAGRMWGKGKKKFHLANAIIIIGFCIGAVIASGDFWRIVISFAAGAVIGIKAYKTVML